MRNVIRQSAVLPASAEKLFEMYINSPTHQALTGAPVEIGDKRGSTLILSFASEGDGGRIDLVHLDVPDQDYEGVNQGWDKYYWTPWRTYLASM